MRLKIAFDIGGVLSRFPAEYKALIKSLAADHDLYIITDMNYETALRVCQLNGISEFISGENIVSCDWTTLQDMCKAVAYERLEIDVAFDDRPDYIHHYPRIGLNQLPRPDTNYYNESWIQ